MATRKCFISTPCDGQIFSEIDVEFTYHTGFSLTQKQKSIQSMHQAIARLRPALKVLEVSTKSPNPLGVALSAFNLLRQCQNCRDALPVENLFHAAKVFERGGPYGDLLGMHPRDAKRDDRLHTSGSLTGFFHEGEQWATEPKSMFYDWLYMSALEQNEDLALEVLEYSAFTDIEFNHTKSFSCQARSLAIFVSLKRLGAVQRTLEDRDLFKKIYEDLSQGSLW